MLYVIVCSFKKPGESHSANSILVAGHVVGLHPTRGSGSVGEAAPIEDGFVDIDAETRAGWRNEESVCGCPAACR